MWGQRVKGMRKEVKRYSKRGSKDVGKQGLRMLVKREEREEKI